MRLAASRGGCDTVSVECKARFSHLAAYSQCAPGVAERLLAMGCTREGIDAAFDSSGVEHCLTALQQRGIHIRFDGSVVVGDRPADALNVKQVLWGQARKLHTAILDSLAQQEESQLRSLYEGRQRDLARLSSCSGGVSSRWLTEFAAIWWPAIQDDKFVVALRFRLASVMCPGRA